MGLLVACAYYVGARLGVQVPYGDSTIALIWPASGVALAALLRLGRRMALGVFAGALGSGLALHMPLPVALWIAVGNTLGPLMAAQLLHRSGFDCALRRRRDVLGYLAFAVFLGLGLTAFSGVGAMVFGGAISADQAPDAWLHWWIADAVGALLVGVPLMTSSWKALMSGLRYRRGVEFVAAGLLLATVSVWVLQASAHWRTAPQAFLPVLLLGWTAARSGLFPTSLLTLAFAAMPLLASMRGDGPFSALSQSTGLMLLWAYLLTLTMATAFIAALVSELLESREHARAALSTGNIGILQMTLEGRIFNVNQHGCAMLGYGRGEMLQRYQEEFLHSEDIARHRERFRQLVRGEVAELDGEQRVIAADGGALRVQFSIGLVRDSLDRPAFIVGFFKEIVPQHEARKAQAHDRAIVHALFDALPDPTWLRDGNGELVASNAAFARMLGAQSRSDGNGRWVDAPSAARLRSLEARALATGAPFTQDVHLTLADGRVACLELSLTPVSLGGELLRGVMCVGRDLMERRRDELALGRHAAVMDLIARLQSKQLVDGDHGQLPQAALDELLRFTDSRAGLVAEFDERGCARVLAEHWGLRERIAEPQLQALFGDVLLQRTPMARATEDGAGQTDLLCVPLWVGEEAVGAILLADRLGGYEPGLIGSLQPLFHATAGIMRAQRSDRRRRQAEEQLREHIDLLQNLAQQVPGAIFQFRREVDGSQRFSWASGGGAALTGLAQGEMLGDARRMLERIHEADAPEVLAAIEHSARTLEPWQCEYRFQSDQGLIWVEGRSVPQRLADGVLVWHGLLTDISARKASEARLRMSASVYEHSHDGIVISDAAGRSVDANRALVELTGYSRQELLDKPLHRLCSLEGPVRYDRASVLAAIARDGAWHGELTGIAKNGKRFVALCTVSMVSGQADSGQHLLSTFKDITELKEQQRKLTHLAHYDLLTQLPNRVMLASRLDEEMRAARGAGRLLGVCYVDMDGFKTVNDRLGHAFGDRLLIAVAERLLRLPEQHYLAARFGGDEFVILLTGARDEAEIRRNVSGMLTMLSDPYRIGEERIVLTASVGVAIHPQGDDTDDDADSLIRQADQAMYAAKQSGRNRYEMFDAALDREVRSRNEARARIEAALDAREFEMVYEPKIDLRSSQVIGFESLIRWRHPQRGLLSPAAFLPLIDDTPFAITLGEWVLSDAFKRAEQWLAQGLPYPISVNIAARHLQTPGFLDSLKRLLDAHPAVPPAMIELEVVETAALEDINHVSSVIRESAALGLRFALDDFGTGYSSMEYLKRLKAETLKIDRSFILDMLRDADDRAIVEGIVGLARAFGRRVIAEGVETVEHGRLLLELGCIYGQGWGISKPLHADAVPGWVRGFAERADWMGTGRPAGGRVPKAAAGAPA
jgi:diguanylate cyclase (GGDEF)-like protein/PAS domain S-box-containing protein